MTEFTELHSEFHEISEGAILIDQTFTGNTLFVEVDFNTILDRSGLTLGLLYIYSDQISSAYRLTLKDSILQLPISNITKLRFLPTLDLYSNYSLTVKYASVGSVIDSPNAYPLPDAITGLPNRVNELEINSIEYSNRIANLETNPSASTWEDLSGKPNLFPPQSHNHAITDVINLGDNLSTIGSRLNNLESIASSNSMKNSLEKFRDTVSNSLAFFYADIKTLAADFISENPLSIQGVAPLRAVSQGLTGLKFLGGGSGHYFANHNSNLDITGDITYLVIIRTGAIPSPNPANLQGVLCKQSDIAGGHALFTIGNKLSCEFTNNSGSTFNVESIDTLQANNVYCLRAYRSGGVVGVQIDNGVKTEVNTFTGTLAIQSSTALRIGNKVSTTFGFEGVIYLAAICNGAISDTEWSNLVSSYQSILK